MSNYPFRKIFETPDGRMQISTNIPGFKWPTREEKIAGLLEMGMIDQAEADRLRAKASLPAPPLGKDEQ